MKKSIIVITVVSVATVALSDNSRYEGVEYWFERMRNFRDSITYGMPEADRVEILKQYYRPFTNNYGRSRMGEADQLLH